MELLYFIVGVIIVFAFGASVISLIRRSREPKIDGVLRIDRSDPDGPFMFLEISKGVNELSVKEHVTFAVKDENYISHQ